MAQSPFKQLRWNILGTAVKKKPEIFGLILMFLASMFLVLGNSLFQFVHMKSRSHVSSTAMLIIRSVIQLVFCVPFMAYRKIHLYGKEKKNLLPLVGMGVFEVFVIVFMYEAIQRMPVGDATVLQFTAPVFTAFLSFIFLKKKLSWFNVIFGIASFIGVVFIAKSELFFPSRVPLFKVSDYSNVTLATTNTPDTELTRNGKLKMHYSEGAIFAIAASFSLSCFFVLNTVVGKIDVTLTIFYPSVVGVISGPLIMLIRKESVSTITGINGFYWGIIIVIGITAFIGLMLLGESLQLANPVPAILVRNCDVIFVYLYQYLLVRMAPTIPSLIGTIIILSCTTMIALNQSYHFDYKLCGNNCGGEEPDESGEDDEKLQFLNNIVDEED